MILLAFGLSGYCQDTITLTVFQPYPLQANAGTDFQISRGESKVIGGNPTAAQGYGHYAYYWTPITGLNDPTLANPTASPDRTTTYLLTVTDAQNCSAADEVTISVDASGTVLVPYCFDIRCYPNPVEEELLIEIKGLPAEVTIRLVNTLGDELMCLTTRITGNTFIERIPTQNLPSGIYIIQFLTREAIKFERIIKTR